MLKRQHHFFLSERMWQLGYLSSNADNTFSSLETIDNSMKLFETVYSPLKWGDSVTCFPGQVWIQVNKQI